MLASCMWQFVPFAPPPSMDHATLSMLTLVPAALPAPLTPSEPTVAQISTYALWREGDPVARVLYMGRSSRGSSVVCWDERASSGWGVGLGALGAERKVDKMQKASALGER